MYNSNFNCMKKFYYSLFTAATLLLSVTSCSQEEDFAQSSNDVTTFSISLNDATQSRAVGEGNLVDKLYYAVYQDNEKVYPKIGNGEVAIDDKKVKFDLPLLKGEEYDIIFWAQKSGNEVYDISNLSAIKVNYTVAKSNQDSYDAFYNALDNFEADGKEHTVKLRRPFAQLNLGTSDWEEANSALKEGSSEAVTHSSVEITGLANTFEPLAGKASGNVTANFDAAAISKEEFTVAINGTAKTYTNLSFNYLLVPCEQKPNGEGNYTAILPSVEKALVNVTYTLYRVENKALFTMNPICNVPVQRNYRTNIVGELLTGTSFDIEIEPDKDGGENMEVTKVGSQAEIQEAIDNAPTDGTASYLEVTGDITFGVESKALSRAAETSYISIPAGKNIVLDLSGYNISGTDKKVTGSFSLIELNPGSNLSIINSSTTIGNVTLTANNNREWSAYSSVISNQRATLTMGANVVVEHKGGTAMAYGIDNLTNTGAEHAKTTIEGATIKSTYRAIRQFLNSSATDVNNELYVKSGTIEGSNKSIWMQDANTSANPGKLIVSAEAALKGDVYLTVTAGSAEWPVEVSIVTAALKDGAQVLSNNAPVGYAVIEKDGSWIVEKGIVENGDEYLICNAAGLKWIASQVDNKNTFEGKTVKLTANIDLNNEQWIPIGNKDLAGETFNGTFDGGNFIISNLKHHYDGEDYFVGLFGCLDNATIKNLTITNVDIKLTGNGTWGHIGAVAGWVQGTSYLQNIKVNGSVKIEGEMTQAGSHRIGAVVGGNQGGNVTFTNIVVEADEQSYVKGLAHVGGIAGQLQTTNSFENCSSNINVYASQYCAGGIIGTAATNSTFNKCVTTGDVSVLAGEDDQHYRVGGIAGSWADNITTPCVLTDCSYSGTLSGTDVNETKISIIDCLGYVGRGWSEIVNAIVSVNGKEYEYLGEGKYAVDGYEVVANGVFKKGVEYNVSNAEGLAYMNTIFADKTAGRDVVLNLTADIDFTGKTWIPVDSHADTKFEIAEINGNGHTISNLTINGQAMFTRFAGSGDVTIKDITFDKATVNSNDKINTSILTVQSYQNVLLDNVDVKNSSITGGYKVAPLIATVYNENSNTITATLKNCDVENTTVQATTYDFCTTGMIAFVNASDNEKIVFENCTVKNVNLYAPNDSYKAHASIYTIGGDSDELFNEAEGVIVTNVTFLAN